MADACANNAVNRSRRLAGILNTKSFGGDSVTAAVRRQIGLAAISLHES
jgi:hypothetical protein